MTRLIKPTSDWGPDNGDYREYIKPRAGEIQHGDQRYVQDIIRHQNDLCYVDVDIGTGAGHLNTGARGIEKARHWVLRAARR